MKLKQVFVVADTEATIGELCAGGRELGETVTAFVFGDEELGKRAISLGADEVIICDAEALPEEYAKSLAMLIQEKQANLVLLTSTVRSRLMAGKLAAYLGGCVTAGASKIEIVDGAATTTRMVYGGAAVRTEKAVANIPVVTLGVGVFSAPEPDDSRNGIVTKVELQAENRIKRLETREKKEAKVNLATARCIVDMGRGFAKEEDLELGRKLSELLGADVGCSRPVAESNGWMPRARYIGVTGVIVKPEVCLLLGISGQVQHLVGINQSKTVVAINKDKDAPIFQHADFGVVGDMYKILPAVIERFS